MDLTNPSKRSTANWWIWGGTVFMIVLLMFLDHLVGMHSILRYVDRLRSSHWAAALFTLVYIASYSTLPLGFMPIASGAIFGFAKGALIANIAENMGAFIPFLVTRKFSRKTFSPAPPASGASKYLDPAMSNFWSVFVGRFIGLPHYVVINYAAALSGLRLRSYLVANFFGMLLWLLSITYFSDRLWAATINGGEAVFRHKLLVALWPLLIIKIVTLVVLYFLKKVRSKPGLRTSAV
jgi:uncharacterized membrane protein YdjX (TVP38/TMEM64 family)